MYLSSHYSPALFTVSTCWTFHCPSFDHPVSHSGSRKPSQKLIYLVTCLFCCSSLMSTGCFRHFCLHLFIVGISRMWESIEKLMASSHVPVAQNCKCQHLLYLPCIFLTEIKCCRDYCGSHSPLFPSFFKVEVTINWAMVRYQSLECCMCRK